MEHTGALLDVIYGAYLHNAGSKWGKTKEVTFSGAYVYRYALSFVMRFINCSSICASLKSLRPMVLVTVPSSSLSTWCSFSFSNFWLQVREWTILGLLSMFQGCFNNPAMCILFAGLGGFHLVHVGLQPSDVNAKRTTALMRTF